MNTNQNRIKNAVRRKLFLNAFIATLISAGAVAGAQTQTNTRDCRIAIDVGHTQQRPGATSARGLREFFFNQRIARLLRGEINNRKNLAAFIINEEGTDISLRERTDAANGKGADLLISVHHDSLQPRYLSSWTFNGEKRPYSDRFRGYSLFYSAKNPRADVSLAFARRIGSYLRAGGFTPTLHHAEPIEGENRVLVDPHRGIYLFDDLVVLKHSDMAAVLLECGVILNREEEALLSNPAYQHKLVSALADAIAESCRSDIPGKPRENARKEG